ncbi:MAG: hypothetical protein JXR34_04220 [Bacteroidales bacterium]|nr:hypothetical protein [Bacteroidales bacterium]
MNFLKITLVTIFASILIISGCKPYNCSRENSLFTSNYLVKPIPFDSLASVESTLSYLQNQYCVLGDTILPAFYFNFQKNKITASSKWGSIPVLIEPIPCDLDMIEYNLNSILEINLDGNNILIEGKRMPLDSIAPYISFQYLNYGKNPKFSDFPTGNGIWLITELKRPISDLNDIIGEVLKGYHQTAQTLSYGLFGKNICDLNEEEWEKFNQRMQFRLSIKYSDEIEPTIQIGNQ